jgi:Mrp family chromosome partitioning ATPase
MIGVAMEHIKHALERARSINPNPAGLGSQDHAVAVQQAKFSKSDNGPAKSGPVIALDPKHLESVRIVAHDVMDPRSKSFDMLRTQVVRTMSFNKWQLVGITSPTPACGKTVTATNLALSIARQPEKSALLIDLDLQRPRVAAELGLQRDIGLLSVLEGRSSLSDAIVRAAVGDTEISVLPCEKRTSYSSEWMASSAMADIIQSVRKDYSSHVVVIDMPPVLASDDVISILPQLDCLLLVVAVGTSSVADIEQCNKHLQSAEVVRVVLNKSSETRTGYYY